MGVFASFGIAKGLVAASILALVGRLYARSSTGKLGQIHGVHKVSSV
jgi:hypothetical protein